MTTARRWEAALRRALSRTLLGPMFKLAIKDIRFGGKCDRG